MVNPLLHTIGEASSSSGHQTADDDDGIIITLFNCIAKEKRT